MIGFAIFSIVAMGLTLSAIFSMRMSHLNVMRTTAYASAQGFLEQIKVVPEESIAAAVASPDAVPLPTRSISAQSSTAAIDIEDPLYLEDPNATAQGQNYKQIVIDVKGSGDDMREILMDIWYDLNVTELTFANGYLIDLDFTYVIPGVRGVSRQSGHLSMVRSSQSGESE